MAFEVQKLKDGLWRWTAPHPEWQPEKGGPGGWGQQVGCIYYETAGAVVLIDPLAPPYGTPDAERFWKHLDEDIARTESRIVVLLANRYHGRSAAAIRDRYQGRRPIEIWAHEAAKDHLKVPVSHWFQDGRGLPAGVRAIPLHTLGPDEVAFYLPEHQALVVADAILGAGNGTLRLAPKSWAPLDEKSQEHYASWFRSEIRGLLDLPIEMVLVSHGEPALANGRAALIDALANNAWGQ